MQVNNPKLLTIKMNNKQKVINEKIDKNSIEPFSVKGLLLTANEIFREFFQEGFPVQGGICFS